MAIEVTREGVEKTHNATCKFCKSEMRLQTSDGKLVRDYRLVGSNCKTGTALTFNCPVCKSLVWVYDPLS